MDCNGQQAGTLPRPDDPDMTTRLANVVYWAGCVLAVIWLAYFLHAISTTIYVADWSMALGVTLGGAVVIWMIGRGIRYVMTGK
jgi:hypothetical protein